MKRMIGMIRMIRVRIVHRVVPIRKMMIIPIQTMIIPNLSFMKRTMITFMKTMTNMMMMMMMKKRRDFIMAHPNKTFLILTQMISFIPTRIPIPIPTRVPTPIPKSIELPPPIVRSPPFHHPQTFLHPIAPLP